MNLITKDEVAKLFRVRNRTVEKWVKEGRIPPPLKIGRYVWWDEDELMAWLKSELKAKMNTGATFFTSRKGEDQ